MFIKIGGKKIMSLVRGGRLLTTGGSTPRPRILLD